MLRIKKKKKRAYITLQSAYITHQLYVSKDQCKLKEKAKTNKPIIHSLNQSQTSMVAVTSRTL